MTAALNTLSLLKTDVPLRARSPSVQSTVPVLFQVLSLKFLSDVPLKTTAPVVDSVMPDTCPPLQAAVPVTDSVPEPARVPPLIIRSFAKVVAVLKVVVPPVVVEFPKVMVLPLSKVILAGDVTVVWTEVTVEPD